MAEKKDRAKFTLRFNMADPQQMKTVEILEQQGRRTAQFLTNAVMHYLHCPQTPEIPQQSGIGQDELEKRVLEILQRYAAPQQVQKPETVVEVPKEVEQPVQTLDPADDLQGLKRFEGMALALTSTGIPLDDQRILWYTTEDLPDFFSGDMDDFILIHRNKKYLQTFPNCRER